MRTGSLRGSPLARLVPAYHAGHAGPCCVVGVARTRRKKLQTRKCGSAYPNCATCSPHCYGAGGTALSTCCIGPTGEDIINCSTKLNRRRAQEVLSKIDAILAWEARHENERDTRFVELGKYLCEVRAGQYWRLEKLKSFDEFLERRFPESRRKAYYLMSIHEHLPPHVRKELRQVGWTKGLELAKLARHQGQRFESATWLHKARQMPKAEFQREVERELTGKDSEPSELIYFKVYKSQMPVIE